MYKETSIINEAKLYPNEVNSRVINIIYIVIREYVSGKTVSKISRGLKAYRLFAFPVPFLLKLFLHSTIRWLHSFFGLVGTHFYPCKCTNVVYESRQLNYFRLNASFIFHLEGV